MASLDYRLNPLFTIKECSSCGALYTRNCGCSKESLEDKILVPKPPQNCATCGDPVDGLYCRSCAFVRKCLNEACFDQTQTPQYTVHHPIFKKEEERRIAEDQAAKDRYWKIPICYDEDEDYTIAITPVLSTKEPVDSLIMEDEHLDTIPATESDEVIKSSVGELVLIPRESEGISYGVCDKPLCDNPTPLKAFKDHSEIVLNSNDDSTSSDDDDFEDIEYMSLEEKLLNINRLIANIKSLNDNPTPNRVLNSPSPIPFADSDSFFEKSDTSLSYSDNSLPEFESFSDHTEETRSGSSTTHANYSLPEYDSFLFEIEPDQGGLTSVVISDNSNDPLLELPQFESFYFDPSFPRPPPEPPDVEISLNFEPDAPVINNFDELNEDECFDPGGGKYEVQTNMSADTSYESCLGAASTRCRLTCQLTCQYKVRGGRQRCQSEVR
ncbi:hypothetical protein Tco_0505278, partial [Tanacetum coccineum]